MVLRSARLTGFGVLMLLALSSAAACGEKKDAKDPGDDARTTGKEETPKWEGPSAPQPNETVKPKSSSSSSGGAVQEAPARRTDTYDKEGTEVVLKRAARQVKDNCGQAKDDNGKAIGPWGKLTIQVNLQHNGHSKQVTVPSPYSGKPAGNCIEKAFTNLTFPPWSGADAQIDWDIELVEPKTK